ncbi:hypothetical protein F66182_15583, partial [Fusarium sp. NRRL 66182]
MVEIEIRDDTSSVYSRSPDEPKATVGQPALLETMLTQPITNGVDHSIGDMCGSTMSLEMSPSRLHWAKSQRLSTLAVQQQELREELTWHNWENIFYGKCHDLFEDVMLATIDVADDLLSQAQIAMLRSLFYPEEEPVDKQFLYEAALKFNATLQ